jgi:membrane-associated phospholipid phosphatase
MYLSPFASQMRLRRRLGLALAILVAMLIATLLDRAVFKAAFVGAQRREVLLLRDWMQLFRVAGYLPTWILLWTGLTLVAGFRAHWRDRSRLALVLAPLVAGVIAEVAKRVLGRERPDASAVEAWYVFKPILSGFWDTKNLGLPSSHAAVAWAGACAGIALAPRAWPVFALLALGCSWHRMVTGAHFLSDVALGAILGYLAWRLVRPGGWHGAAGPRYLP